MQVTVYMITDDFRATRLAPDRNEMIAYIGRCKEAAGNVPLPGYHGEQSFEENGLPHLFQEAVADAPELLLAQIMHALSEGDFFAIGFEANPHAMHGLEINITAARMSSADQIDEFIQSRRLAGETAGRA